VARAPSLIVSEGRSIEAEETIMERQFADEGAQTPSSGGDNPEVVKAVSP
jgi:hypothetical protein